MNKLKKYTKKIITITLIIFVILIGIITFLKEKQEKEIIKFSTAPKSSGYLYQRKSKGFIVYLGSRSTKQSPEIKMAVENSSIDFKPEGNLSDQTKLDRQDQKSIVYKNVYPGIDFLYTLIENGVKEEIIINNQQSAANNPQFTFKLNLNNALIQKDLMDDSALTFVDSVSEKYLFHFEKPFMIDAGGNRSEQVKMTLNPPSSAGSPYSLSLIPDPTWLKSALYPVIIDPTIVLDNADTVANWTSSDDTYFTKSQDTSDKQEGTGSVKVVASSGYTQQVFNSSGTFTVPAGVTAVEVLVVAGGGAGVGGSPNNYYKNGGGGAGGVTYDANYSITPEEEITVTVGGQSSINTSGNASAFGTISVTGGGKGGLNGAVGTAGGSGGGGGGLSYGWDGTQNGGAATASEGYAGGTGLSTSATDINLSAGGGGGGAGSVGGNYSGTTGGNGGTGVDYSSIFGTGVGVSGWFAGGGGAAGGVTAGTASSGGGAGTAVHDASGSNGTANTGGGGGGARAGTGGTGGSGVVIVKYLLNSLNDTITRDLGVSGTKDLSGNSTVNFWIKSSRTGTYLQFGMGETAWNNNTTNVTINSANTWEEKTWDISGISDANKDAIRYLGFKTTNADSNFTMKFDDIKSVNLPPIAPTSLLTEGQTNPSGVTDTTPEFSAIYNDPDSGDIANKYRIQVDDDPAFGSTIWDSGESGTAMSNCIASNRCSDISYGGVSTDLQWSTKYYWRIKFWDDDAAESDWDTESAYFTMSPIYEPTACMIDDSGQNDSLIVKWNDNTTLETGYRVERSVDGTAYSLLTTEAINATSSTDNTTISNSTYKYRIRANSDQGNSQWCSTETVDYSTGNLNFKGVIIR